MTIREIAVLLRQAPPDDEWLAVLAADARAGVRRLASQWRRAQDRVGRERRRLDGMFAVERARRAEGYGRVAGVDEAGMGPLAGPVVAAAVMLPREELPSGLNDSKMLLPEEREAHYGWLLGCGAAIGIGVADVAEIDRFNILQAARLAWRRAITQLAPAPDFVILDGRLHADLRVPQMALVDADAQCACVAAASIVAKVTRDRIMRELDARFPEFGFGAHKGYATPVHLAAIRRHGFSPAHRRSFVPLRVFQGELFDALA